MDAPTEWTYGGQLDFSSADTLKLAPPGMPIYCIVEALKEKATSSNYTLPSILTADWNPLQPPYPVISTIQTAVNTLISKYCNHQTGGGDFTGLSEPPLWTELDILSVIGASERIVPERLDLMREWIFQQYQILNLLRWSRSYYSFTTSANDGFYVFYSESQPWWGAGGSESDCISNWHTPDISSLGYNGTRISGAYEASKTQFKYAVYNGVDLLSFDDFDCVCDFYLSATTRPSQDNDEFHAQGDGVLEDQVINIGSVSFSAGNQMTPNDYFPNSNCPSYFSANGPGWFQDSVYAVLKFDGANGFKFRDW